MDMDLVPKHADEESFASGVHIDPIQTRNPGVKMVTVMRGPLTFVQSFLMNVSYNEYQYATVRVRIAGFINKVCSLTVGDKVQKGTPLLDLTIPNQVKAQGEYLLLYETGGTAAQVEGILGRLRLAGIPEAGIHRPITTQKIQTRFTPKVSIDGVITALGLRVGVNITKDNVVAKIQGVDPVRVTAVIPEPIAQLVKDISQFTLTVPARPDKALTIRKWALLPGVDTATRTLQLRLEVDDVNEALKPGMNV